MLLFVHTHFAVQKAAQRQGAALPPAGPAGNAGSLHGGTGKPASAKQMWVVPQIEPEEEGAATDSAAAGGAPEALQVAPVMDERLVYKAIR